MTRKRTRSLRQCAYFRTDKCPYVHLVEAGKYKCGICVDRKKAGANETSAGSKVDDSSEEGKTR